MNEILPSSQAVFLLMTVFLSWHLLRDARALASFEALRKYCCLFCGTLVSKMHMVGNSGSISNACRKQSLKNLITHTDRQGIANTRCYDEVSSYKLNMSISKYKKI